MIRTYGVRVFTASLAFLLVTLILFSGIAVTFYFYATPPIWDKNFGLSEGDNLATLQSFPRTGVSDQTERVDLLAGEALTAAIRSVSGDHVLSLPPFSQNRIHSVLFVGYKAGKPVDFRPVCVDENRMTHPMKRSRTLRSGERELFLEIPLPDCMTSAITLRWPQTSAEELTLTQAYVLKDLSDEDNLIDIKSYTANTVRVKVGPLPGPRILTFLDSAYPGWCAWVDDEEVELLRANDAFKAVYLPAGTHEVRFAFQPPTVYRGAAVSAVTWFLLMTTLALLTAAYALRALPFRRSPADGPSKDDAVPPESPPV